MEDVKLEFPSLPQCKDDAEVRLPRCHAQAFRGACGRGGDPGPPSQLRLGWSEPRCPSRASRDLGAEPGARLSPYSGTSLQFLG
jgi:hypothetical protein